MCQDQTNKSGHSARDGIGTGGQVAQGIRQTLERFVRIPLFC